MILQAATSKGTPLSIAAMVTVSDFVRLSLNAETVRPLPSGRKSDTERGRRLISARFLNSSLDRKSI